MLVGSFLVSVTEVCTVGCRHCGFRGSTRDREATREELSNWVLQICDYGVPRLIFTGGEAFQRFDLLCGAVQAATTSRRPPTIGIFTSSHWAKSEVETRDKLRQIEGVSHLYLSSDIYHQERVPHQNVLNVIRAALELGIRNISICMTISEDWEEQHIRNLYTAYESHLMFHVDRVIPTPFLAQIAPAGTLHPPKPVHYKSSCYLDTPLLNPNGDISACHAGKAGALVDLVDTPYFLGNLHQASLRTIFDNAETNAEYQFLRCFGPKGVAEAIERSSALRATLRYPSFTSGCDLCFKTLAFPDARKAFQAFVNSEEQQALTGLARLVRFGERVGAPAEKAA
jgi:hypothetical protein